MDAAITEVQIMENTLTLPIPERPMDSALDRSHERSARSHDGLHWTENALGRAATGLVCIGAMAVAVTQLGTAGLPISCALATLAVGLKIHGRVRQLRR